MALYALYFKDSGEVLAISVRLISFEGVREISGEGKELT
jgi:hypothetical protein